MTLFTGVRVDTERGSTDRTVAGRDAVESPLAKYAIDLPPPGLKRRSALKRLCKLKGVILLAGTVRRASFVHTLGRSLLSLPISANRTVLDLWRSEVARLAATLEQENIPCRIIVGKNDPIPDLCDEDRLSGLTIERETSDLRGTGGLLRDLTDDQDGGACYLVANAGQILTEPLGTFAFDVASQGGEVTVAGNPDGSPASLFLITRKALSELPAIGFCDLKEQGLPLIGSKHEITVLKKQNPSGLSIRTPQEYLRALRAHHRMLNGKPLHVGPFGETWQSEFAIVESDARVAPNAKLHDAVVLHGAQVSEGASVVNSIVCDGANVSRGESIRDSVAVGGKVMPLDSVGQ